MPKHHYSSSSSNSNISISNPKKKIKKRSDSLCAHCTSIDRGECISYSISDFEEIQSIHINSNEAIDIDTYLNSRISKIKELSSFTDKTTEEDCIIFDHEKNNIKINDTLINSKNITISKYISKGCYGIILVSSALQNEPEYVIKLIIYNNNNKHEINTMIDIKQKNNTNIPNFINIAYYHLKCNKIIHNENNLLKRVSYFLKDKQYTMLILEYFDGDVYNLLYTNKDNIDLIKFIFSQLLLSIYLLHNKFHYYHNDAHLRNFLYKNVIQDSRYFHYQISGNNFYIKNYGYVIVLSDYGLSTPIEHYNINILKDYYTILFEIKRYLFNEIINDNKTKFEEYLSLNFSKSNILDFNELDFLKFIMINILNINTTISESEKTINSSPYN
jgi:hypothetical protein